VRKAWPGGTWLRKAIIHSYFRLMKVGLKASIATIPDVPQAKTFESEFSSLQERRKHLIDQLIIFSVERIDERDALQRETILQIFGEQVLHASTSRRSP
jgi:hypothetical protein